MLNEWAACGRLDRPPREHCYIRFPGSFGRRFMIFVDTEEQFDWTRPFSRDQRATSAFKAMPAMHARMRAVGAVPVYLVDHPIATDPEAIALLRTWLEKGECAIGTQLHPWVNPPFEEEVNAINSFTGNLPIDLQRAKLETLTATIEQAFGRRPIVYRAGRYGVGRHTAGLLEEAGYRMDVSVRALFDYSDKGGPDFSQVRPQPYWVGDGALLEIPLSAAYTGRLRRRGPSIFPRRHGLRSLLSRSGMLARVALTPEDMPIAHTLEAAAELLADGAQLLSISFHSPSVEPGHTPYVRTDKDLAAFHAWWDGLFAFLARHDVQPATVEEVLAAAEAANGEKP
ncbi:MAG: polysaccharide deacetylase family protein [Sphingomonadales bacterium]